MSAPRTCHAERGTSEASRSWQHKRDSSRHWRWALLVAWLWGLTACAASLPAIPSAPAPAASASVLPGATPPPTPRPPLNLSNPGIVVLAANLPGPDDLDLAPDGSLYLSDVAEGTVSRYTPDGRLRVVVSGLSAPEGIAALPDGSLVIAEQGKNRLVRYDPQTRALTPFLNLENKASALGVDGIVLDARPPAAATLVIPDSPNGRLLRASLDGQAVTEIARGFVRPTGAWVEAGGSLLVTDENAGTLDRVRPDGRLEKLADLPVPDDVVEDGAGNIFVATLGDGAIHVIPAGARQASVLVAGLAGPQGMILDADGNLVVTDPGHHRLIKLVIR
jgi:sugar lactone lactonase YvrE